MYLKISKFTRPQWNSSGGLIGFTDIYGHIHTAETLTEGSSNKRSSDLSDVSALAVSRVDKHQTIAARVNGETIEPLDPTNKIVFRRLFSGEIR